MQYNDDRYNEVIGTAVRFWARIREVFGSNFSRDTLYIDCVSLILLIN
jgi:hypothetical protein